MTAELKGDSLARVRRAVYRRAMKQIRESLRGATQAQLMDAVAEPTAIGTIARLVAASPGGMVGAAAASQHRK
jgi:hypothetical protein